MRIVDNPLAFAAWADLQSRFGRSSQALNAGSGIIRGGGKTGVLIDQEAAPRVVVVEVMARGDVGGQVNGIQG